jgi:hypothetical protein
MASVYRIRLNRMVQSREEMFDHLVWWGEALKAARQSTAVASSVAA